MPSGRPVQNQQTVNSQGRGSQLQDADAQSAIGSEFNNPFDREIQTQNDAASHYGMQHRPGKDPLKSQGSNRVKPQMQTNTTAMGGAPHHISNRIENKSQGGRIGSTNYGRESTIDDGTTGTMQTSLKFDEIVLESNEIDMAEIQADPSFTERRFPQAIYIGVMIEGKRNGKGVMKYANGR